MQVSSLLFVCVQSEIFAPWPVCRHMQDASQGSGYLGGSEKTNIPRRVNSLTVLWGWGFACALLLSFSPYPSCLPSYFPAFLCSLRVCSALPEEPHRLSERENKASMCKHTGRGVRLKTPQNLLPVMLYPSPLSSAS